MIRIQLMKYINKPFPSAHVNALRRGFVPNVIHVYHTWEFANYSAGLCVKDDDGRGIPEHREQTMVSLVKQHREVCPSVGNFPCRDSLPGLTVEDSDRIGDGQVHEDPWPLRLKLIGFRLFWKLVDG